MLPLKNIRERDVFSDVADNGVPELFSILFFFTGGDVCRLGGLSNFRKKFELQRTILHVCMTPE